MINIGWSDNENVEPVKVPPDSGEPNLLEELYNLEEAARKLQWRINEIKDALSESIPEEKYVGHLKIGEYVGIAMRDERWEWDVEKIRQIYPNELPPFVKVKEIASIGRKEYKSLDISEQAKLIDALERKPTSVKIVVRKMSDIQKVSTNVETEK